VSVDNNNRLLGHSYSKNVSYVLFDEKTNNDVGAAIASKAIFAYNGYGERSRCKDFGMYYQDGYISPGGELVRKLLYDFDGAGGELIRGFKGNETAFIQYVEQDSNLGGDNLGQLDLGGGFVEVSDPERRFRYIDAMVAKDFYELQVSYEQEALGASWRLVAHGPDVDLNSNNNNDIIRE